VGGKHEVFGGNLANVALTITNPTRFLSGSNPAAVAGSERLTGTTVLNEIFNLNFNEN
jgi:hypothetical protein